ncbi:MAG: DNA-directed RNA polymerase subunit alpha [Kiritimatiellae bacterium]|nr:DNA-directed RNA polymerase subunit alpha [Kiritimatiellia bacterium]MBQ9343842.1 DNA-directed RNA polymerase subunit alpha [Kiritimatiellia bacterium]
MSKGLDAFQMPETYSVNEQTRTPTYAEFTAGPFEPGFGRTIGNSLRRVLLSSLEGASIISVRIAGADHEFCSLKGCVEDVTEIILNLKKILFKFYSSSPKSYRIDVKGPGEVTAADIQVDQAAEVVNPDQHICTLADDGAFKAEVTIKFGRGYVPADGNKPAEQEIGLIPIDSLFSPVRRVKFDVQDMRHASRVDYDKLILEIWTDGRIEPEAALNQAAAIIRHHFDIFVSSNFTDTFAPVAAAQPDPDFADKVRVLKTSVNEIELSVRAANCLNNANITTVGELCQKTEAEMLRFRNFGKKSLNEIKQKLKDLGFDLGMTFSPEILAALKEDNKD